MEGNTNNTNEDIRSNINIIDTASDQSLSTSCTDGGSIQHDDDIKTSEPVAEGTEAMVNQTNQTVKRIFRTVENVTSSSLNVVDLGSATTMSSSRIIDISSIPTSTDVQPYVAPRTNPQESQIAPPTTDNSRQQLGARKHIMISYNRATATTVCQKIYDRLTAEGYNVWFDRENLTDGSIIDAMGEAIDNAYVVLLCMNEGYSNSRYCPKEAKYAQESNVPLIPCMMEEKYRPRGGLGIIKSDLKHIEFFDDDKFDESFKELTRQIDTIEARSEMRSVVVDNTDFGDRFNAILTEHMQLIQNLCLRRRNLNETELRTVLRRLIQEFSPETWQSFQNDLSNDVNDRQIQEEDNDRLLQHLIRTQQENYARIERYLLDQDERLAAFQRFQQRQEQEHVRLNFNEHLLSLFHIQEVQQQGQERNDHIVGQLVRQIDRLTELAINQQQQHAREMEAMHQLVNRSLEASSNAQQRQTSHFDLNTFKDLIQVIVLLCTLLVLLKD